MTSKVAGGVLNTIDGIGIVIVIVLCLWLLLRK
jgi:hypothetical protein